MYKSAALFTTYKGIKSPESNPITDRLQAQKCYPHVGAYFILQFRQLKYCNVMPIPWQNRPVLNIWVRNLGTSEVQSGIPLLQKSLNIQNSVVQRCSIYHRCVYEQTHYFYLNNFDSQVDIKINGVAFECI